MFNKVIVYFFTLLFLTGGMLEKEMSKWDGYWRHFQSHKHRNENYTFTRFVYVHFLDGEHNKWRKNRHRSFPFEKRMMQGGQTFICNVNKPSVEVFMAFIIKNIPISYISVILAGFPSSILRPPSA